MNDLHVDYREGGLTEEAIRWARHASFYHKPTEAAVVAHNEVNASCELSLRTILENCPPSADRTHAVNHVRQARMWANSAIALE